MIVPRAPAKPAGAATRLRYVGATDASRGRARRSPAGPCAAAVRRHLGPREPSRRAALPGRLSGRRAQPLLGDRPALRPGHLEAEPAQVLQAAEAVSGACRPL